MEISNKENENKIYADTSAKIEDIQKLDLTPEIEKELAYRIGSAVFDVGREMNDYCFGNAPLFIHDAFERIYSMVESGRNNEHEIPIIKDLANDSERIFKYLRLIEVLIQRIDTNTQGLERKVKREDTEREKVIGEMVGEMRNQNP
jgi:histidinol phosphatase-like PHP family hydrolase